MTLNPQWVRSAIKVAMVAQVFLILLGLAVGMFGHLLLMLVNGIFIVLITVVFGFIEERYAEWRQHHVELRGFTLLLTLSMLAHADRPIHAGICACLIVVLHCVPFRLLRPTSAFIVAVLLVLAQLSPFSVLDYFGPSAPLSTVYRISNGLVLCPFFLYVLVRQTKDQTLDELVANVRNYKMTAKEREAQRRDFTYGNLKLHNPEVTREMVDEAAEKIRKERGDV